MSEIRKTYLYDGAGNPVNAYYDSVTGKYALDVHMADVHKRTINYMIHRDLATFTTVAVDAPEQATSITVASTVGFAVGDYLHIENGVQESTIPSITALPGGNVITLDKPLDNAFAIGTTVTRARINMNEVGSLVAPISYRAKPLPGEIWHVTGITLAMAHTTAGDFGTFGNIVGGLVNGTLLRRYDGTTGKYGTFSLWKTNGDIDLDTGTVKFPPRSGGGGTYGTAADGRLKDRTESIAYLNGNNGDFMEILVQDDLSSLGLFIAEVQGHYESL